MSSSQRLHFYSGLKDFFFGEKCFFSHRSKWYILHQNISEKQTSGEVPVLFKMFVISSVSALKRLGMFHRAVSLISNVYYYGESIHTLPPTVTKAKYLVSGCKLASRALFSPERTPTRRTWRAASLAPDPGCAAPPVCVAVPGVVCVREPDEPVLLLPTE